VRKEERLLFNNKGRPSGYTEPIVPFLFSFIIHANPAAADTFAHPYTQKPQRLTITAPSEKSPLIIINKKKPPGTDY